MLQRLNANPKRILMTVDAVGGVWQYALALARELSLSGDTILFAGVGPAPKPEQEADAEALGFLTWLRTPPDWMAGAETELDGLAGELSALVRDHAIDLVQINEPGQGAGLELPCPVVAVSHSCIATWFRAVRDSRLPDTWAWHLERTRAGFQQADLVVAPSASHAAALTACYGPSVRPIVVHNAIEPVVEEARRENVVFAAGRWWDAGKNGAVLDQAAPLTNWPIFAAGPISGPNDDAFTFRNVTSLGSIAHAEVRRRAARCGIFVSPSLYEPFGLAALEAATAGTPLVLADIPTYRELWANAAIFFPPRDVGVLADAINQLAEDPQLRRSLGDAAQRRSRSYTLARQAAAMRAAHDEAARTNAGAA